MLKSMRARGFWAGLSKYVSNLLVKSTAGIDQCIFYLVRHTTRPEAYLYNVNMFQIVAIIVIFEEQHGGRFQSVTFFYPSSRVF
jgi:hypothetical protein